jgi:hypothetical protein
MHWTMPTAHANSLCHSCRWLRVITSGRGSTFLFCRKSQQDERFAKYPPQPIMRCRGYAPQDAEGGSTKESPDQAVS